MGRTSSLSHEGAAQSSLSTSMHISQSSELAFALSHRKGSNVAVRYSIRKNVLSTNTESSFARQTSMNQPPTGSSGHSSDSDMDVSVNVSPECQPISDQEPMGIRLPAQSFSNSSTNSSLMYPISISAVVVDLVAQCVSASLGLVPLRSLQESGSSEDICNTAR